MKRFLVLACSLAFVAGCSDRPDAAPAAGKAQVGDHQEGGSGFTRFYAERLIDVNGRKRILVFGTAEMLKDFESKGEMNPLKSKTYIGKGPGKETVIVEMGDKDTPQLHDRVKKRFMERHGVAF